MKCPQCNYETTPARARCPACNRRFRLTASGKFPYHPLNPYSKGYPTRCPMAKELAPPPPELPLEDIT